MFLTYFHPKVSCNIFFTESNSQFIYRLITSLSHNFNIILQKFNQYNKYATFSCLSVKEENIFSRDLFMLEFIAIRLGVFFKTSYCIAVESILARCIIIAQQL